MTNVSHVTSFTLKGFVELQKHKYLFFAITLNEYILIVICNSVLISIICLNKVLHEPMYIFLCALCVNALYGTIAFYPKLLIDLLSDEQVISYEACIIQIFIHYSYAMSEFSLLTVMAFDRYISICKPLQYNSIMTVSFVKALLFTAWCLPIFMASILIALTTRLTLCGSVLERICCDNWSVVKLSCQDTSVNNVIGLLLLIITVFPPLFFIIYTYIQIISICVKNSREYRSKAFKTCVPHVVAFINFSINVLFEIIHSRLQTTVPHIIKILMSIEYLVIPPVLNPIIYGLKLQEIWKRLGTVMCVKRISQSK
ncbi:olfactory receptor 10J5-like [Polypterus senegalus]